MAQGRKGPLAQPAAERPPWPPRPLRLSRLAPWRSERCRVGVRCRSRQLYTGQTRYDCFLAPNVFPQAVSLTHNHPLYARTPCEGGKTFVEQAPRPFRSRGVCRNACVWHLAPAGRETCEYTSNQCLGEAPKQTKTP